MKQLFRILTVTILLLSVGCIDDDLYNRLDNLEERVSKLEELCREMNTNISSLQTIVTALQTNDYVTAVTPIVEDGKTVGYTISFVKSDPITIYHGKDGKDGADGEDGKDGQDGKDGIDGYTPVIGVRQDSDGIYYWTLDGDWLLDADGNKIKAQGIDGKDGEDGEDGEKGEPGEPSALGQNGQDGQDGVDGKDGEDGITPQLKIEGEYWYISYDNGVTWTRLGKATGEDGKDGQNGQDGKDGKDGDSFFKSVTQDVENVYFELTDGTVITLPKAQDGVVTTLQTATKGNGIDIVLMGDAYSDRQIADGTYRTDMEYVYNNFFTEEPYKSFKDFFNVYCVVAVSATEGYEYGNTALGGYFGDGTRVGGNDNAVFDYALKAITADHMDEALLIVTMNSDKYAGTCYMYHPDNSAGYGNGVSVAYFPRGGDATTFAQLLHHEACGHGFAKLADEYMYAYMGAVSSDYVSQIQAQQNDWGWMKNVDFTRDLSQIRWSHFLNDSRYQYDGLGAYRGGLTYWSGVWRPTEYSIMRYNTSGFNAPSREAIYYRIHKLAYGDSWQYDYEEFVEWDARNRKTEADAHKAPYRAPANFKHTAPPVVINKSWRDAK